MQDAILPGDVFHHLTVIKRLPNHVTPGGSRFSNYLCRCDCGNVVPVLGTALRSGHTMSCGCLNKRHKVDDASMLGRRFGRLVVVSRADSHKVPSGSVYDRWNCVCDCGNTTISFGRGLRSGHAQSCGCLRVERMALASRIPKAEIWTKSFLDSIGVRYESPKTFDDLFGVNGGLLSYDFWIPSVSLLIELNGLQHYRSVDWFGGYEGHCKQVEHDLRKREYAEKNGYRLISIFTDHISKTALLSKLMAIDFGI